MMRLREVSKPGQICYGGKFALLYPLNIAGYHLERSANIPAGCSRIASCSGTI